MAILMFLCLETNEAGTSIKQVKDEQVRQDRKYENGHFKTWKTTETVTCHKFCDCSLVSFYAVAWLYMQN